MAGDYNLSDIYQGGYSSFKPNYGDIFTGYHAPASSVGAPTKPDTANQIQQVNAHLSQGMIPIEVGALSPEVFDQIPKQHFKEIQRMAKLTGAKISAHSPIVEPSGIGEQGWSESQRQLAENQLKDVIEKTYQMDTKGNIPVTIHSTSLPGTEYTMTPDGKKVEKLVVVDRETGKIGPGLEEEEMYFPGGEKVGFEKMTPEERLDTVNRSEWRNRVDQILFQKERADEILENNAPQMEGLNRFIQSQKDIAEKDPEKFQEIMKTALSSDPNLRQAYNHSQNAQAYLEDVQMHLQNMFNDAYKSALFDKNTPEGKEKIKMLEKMNKDFSKELKSSGGNISAQSQAMQDFMLGLKERNLTPKKYVPLEQYSIKKSAETLGNVAFDSFKKFGEKAPIVSIENMFTGMAFSSGEDMDKLITKTKENFVNKAISKGVSESEAKKQADRIIGMTLDLGHLNISKKRGFKDKDLLKEVEAIKKHVKHVHLADNFGYSDSHLPPGMGNVPNKEILEKLEKAGFKGRKIVEAGGFAQHFGTSPFPSSLEGMGSPMYSEGAGPYWNQATGLQQGYFSGYGNMLPDIHYETMGAGFSQLPAELGGQRGGGAGSRMSGRGME